jgi:putative protease
MKRLSPLPELLSPAGSYEAALAAIQAGADAIYLGTKSFNARAYAQNFDDDALCRIIAYAHAHGVKVYVTLNTLVYDKELSCVTERARVLQQMGADALIVADLGAIRVLKDKLPELELHASTQATVHSSLSADELYSLGVSRVVLSRELSLDNIIKTTALCRPETEIFLHGALCVCHSGQCLFSSLVGGRSGNRGTCAQPCRLPYGKSYPLSLRDLCLAGAIPDLIELGVSSLKIEGRMKTPGYVHGVTSVYRRLLDEERAATPEELRYLARLFSRGGFTDRYYFGRPEAPMTGIRSEEDKQQTREISQNEYRATAARISGSCRISRGAPISLTLTLAERSVTAVGAVPEDAKTAPLDAAAVSARLRKLGGTPFSLAEADLAVHLEPGLNLAPSALNELRRSAVAALTDTLRRSPRAIEVPTAKRSFPTEPLLSLSFRKAEQMLAVEPDGAIPCERFLSLAEADLHPELLPDGVTFPAVVTDLETEEVRRMAAAAKARGVRLARIENVGQLSLARELGLIPIGDFRFNITNATAAALWEERGLADCVLSPELPLALAGHIGGRVIVAGRIPLMLLERCFIRENAGCDRCDKAALTDRKGISFPLVREYPHRNLLLNSTLTYMGDRKDELLSAGIRRWDFLFTIESPSECRAILDAFVSGKALPFATRRLPRSY